MRRGRNRIHLGEDAIGRGVTCIRCLLYGPGLGVREIDALLTSRTLMAKWAEALLDTLGWIPGTLQAADHDDLSNVISVVGADMRDS